MEKIKGFKEYRHERNPKEKEFHDKFLKEHHRDGYVDMDLIVFGQSDHNMIPNDYLLDRERQIVLSTIQWLGSPVGQGFLSSCGFELKPITS